MNLTLITIGGTRVLKCSDPGVRWSAQENTQKTRFDTALADLNNTIVAYEETTEGIASAKEQLKIDINLIKTATSTAPITVNDVTFQADEKSMLKVLATVVRANRVGAGFSINWVDANNNIVTLSQSAINDLGDAIMDREAAAIYLANTKKAEVAALTTRAEVEAYVI